jgi:hypothetical protein
MISEVSCVWFTNFEVIHVGVMSFRQIFLSEHIWVPSKNSLALGRMLMGFLVGEMETMPVKLFSHSSSRKELRSNRESRFYKAADDKSVTSLSLLTSILVTATGHLKKRSVSTMNKHSRLSLPQKNYCQMKANRGLSLFQAVQSAVSRLYQFNKL